VWQFGMMTNQQIGEKFGLTYSAVIKRVGILKYKLSQDKLFQQKFNSIKAQIKI